MRFATFTMDDELGLALETAGEELRGLCSSDAAYPGDLANIIAGGPAGVAHAAEKLSNAPSLDPERIQFLPPLQSPEKIICIGLNYVDHSAESGFEAPTYPAVFTRFPTSLVGHGSPLLRPVASEQLDYEGELVVIIGQGGRNIAERDALNHVFGYSVFNDGSIRDYQFKGAQWTVGKTFDHTGGFGPFVVTADELPDGAKSLNLETRLNGAVVQKANTNDMIFGVAKLIEILSEAITLKSGDIIVAGTPAGVGLGRVPPLWMKPGDVCEVEIEGVGLLRNPIAQGV